MGRAPCCSKVGLHKGPWSTKEDRLLTDYIQANGEGQWRSLPEKAGLLRCGKSCRLRWMNYLRPGIKRGNITTEEEDLIIRHQSLLGNRWSLIAARLPGRTDNEIKNFWNTHLLKRLKKEGIEPKSNKNVMKEGSKEPKKKTKDDASRKTKPSKLKSIINMDYSDHNQAKKPNIDRDDFDHKEELSMMTKVCVPKPIEVYSKLATSNSFGSVVSGNSSPSNQEEVDKKAKTEACDEDDILRSSFELGDQSYNKRVDICDEDQILFDDCYLLNQGAAPVSEILLEMVYDEYLQLL